MSWKSPRSESAVRRVVTAARGMTPTPTAAGTTSKVASPRSGDSRAYSYSRKRNCNQLGVRPVRPEAVILGPVVEAHVQPRDAGPGGAEPHGSGTNPTSHRLPDRLPEGVPLPLGGLPDERRQVSVSQRRGDRARHHHDRIPAEVGEYDHSRLGCAAKVLGERLRIGSPSQPGAVQQDEFE